MNARNKFFILLGIIFVIAATYYFFSVDHSKDMVLIGTVDANQVIVSAQVEGRIQKLLVDEGTPVKAGDLIAVLDPSELQTQEAAAAANISSLRNKVSEMQHTEASTSGSTSSDVANKSPRCDTPKNPHRARLPATWLTREPNFLRRRRSSCRRRLRSIEPRATAGERSNWPRPAWLPNRNVCRPKPTCRERRRPCRLNRSW